MYLRCWKLLCWNLLKWRKTGLASLAVGKNAAPDVKVTGWWLGINLQTCRLKRIEIIFIFWHPSVLLHSLQEWEIKICFSTSCHDQILLVYPKGTSRNIFSWGCLVQLSNQMKPKKFRKNHWLVGITLCGWLSSQKKLFVTWGFFCQSLRLKWTNTIFITNHWLI